jgi:hypothetical protein
MRVRRIRQDRPTLGMSQERCGEISAGAADAQASASASTCLRRKRLEHRGRPDGQVAQATPRHRENRIADGGRDHGRARFAEPHRSLGAVNDLDVELRHVAAMARPLG